MSVDLILATAASFGLPTNGRLRPSLDPTDVDALIGEASTHRLHGLIDQAVAERAIRCPHEAKIALTASALNAAGWSLVVERHLLVVHELFSVAGVPHRFLKGSAVAHRFYDHPGLRGFVDVDVLVPTKQLKDALIVLSEHGHERVQADPYPGFSRCWAKSVTMTHESDGVEVDVHRTIPDGPFGYRSNPDLLWERPESTVTIGGVDVPAFDTVAAFVHACVNAVASYDRVSLLSLRDVAQIAPSVDAHDEEVRDLATAMGVRACVADAVTRARRDLGWAAPARVDAMADWDVSSVERDWLESYRRPAKDLQRALLGMRAVPSAMGKVRYAGSVALLLAGRPGRRARGCVSCREPQEIIING